MHDVRDVLAEYDRVEILLIEGTTPDQCEWCERAASAMLDCGARSATGHPTMSAGYTRRDASGVDHIGAAVCAHHAKSVPNAVWPSPLMEATVGQSSVKVSDEKAGMDYCKSLPGYRKSGKSRKPRKASRAVKSAAPLELWGVAEIADGLGVKRETVYYWQRQNGKRNFPKPLVKLAMGPVWDAGAVREWRGVTV